MSYTVHLPAVLLVPALFSCGTPAEPVAAQDSAAEPAAELAEWRSKIDEVDREIVALLNRRAGYVEKLAPLKRQIGMAVQDTTREDEVRANLQAANEGPLSDQAVTAVYEAVMAAMRDLQRRNE